MIRTDQPTFEISVSGRSDGTVEAMYIRLRGGKVHKTIEIQEDVLLCDYDRRGNVLGFEVLAPVKISQLVKQVSSPVRKSFEKFVRQSAPDQLVCA